MRHGIPSLNMEIGFVPGSREQGIFKDRLRNHYHAPSGDTSQPTNDSAVALYEEIMRKLLILVQSPMPMPLHNGNPTVFSGGMRNKTRIKERFAEDLRPEGVKP